MERGAKVRLDTAVSEARLVAGIHRAAAESQWTLDDTSDIVISATAGPGKPVTQTFERSRFGFAGRGGGEDFRESVTVTPWLQANTVRQNDKVLWGTGQGGVPGAVSVREGESLQAELNKSSLPSYNLFDRFAFPERVIAPKYANGLGTSLITPSGLVDRPVAP